MALAMSSAVPRSLNSEPVAALVASPPQAGTRKPTLLLASAALFRTTAYQEHAWKEAPTQSLPPIYSPTVAAAFSRNSSPLRIYRLTICTERCPVVAMMARSEAPRSGGRGRKTGTQRVTGVPRRIETRCPRSPLDDESDGLVAQAHTALAAFLVECRDR